MKLGLIYARSRNGVIGRDGIMPWHLPEDLAHFKQLTMGCPVIMGRKTWESLPPKFRPLPGRLNIVVSRQPEWKAEGATRASSLDEAIALCKDAPQAWVMGGAQIYAQAAPRADTAEITEIEAEIEGDAFAPPLGTHWKEVRREPHTSNSGIEFTFVTCHNTQRGA
jgi:dihydrofolate reductase